MHKTFVLLILALAASTMASAQTYKWRDANGQIQYSDTPPPPGAKDVQQLRKAATGPATASSGGKSLADQDAAFRKRLAEKQEADAKQAKANEEEQIRQRNCEQSKGQLAALEAGGRLVQLNAEGERSALDDAERERAIADSRKAVETWCK